MPSAYWPPPRRLETAPLRAGFWRAAAEALLGWAALNILGRLFWFALPLGDLFGGLGWLWLLAWPAWRLRLIVGGPWWSRLARGLLRFAALTLLLAVVVTLLRALGLLLQVGDLHPWPLSKLTLPAPFPFTLYFFRAGVLIVAWLRRWMAPRLRRQLMVSYLTVIFTMLTGFTALGSLLVFTFVVGWVPDARSQARATAEVLRPPQQTATLDRRQAGSTLLALMQGRIRPGDLANSPLLVLIPWNGLARRTMVLDRGGHVLADVRNADFIRGCHRLAPDAPLPTATTAALLRGALAGRVEGVSLPSGLACGSVAADQWLAAAPIYGTRTHIIGVAVVQGPRVTIGSGRSLSVLVAVFSASTFFVIMLTVLPTLAISAIGSWFFARGLTRRVVAVSQAATALATGDLTRRVPITARNEIGRLAEDFNRMASHLEEAMNESRQARTQAEQALRARQELVASVSHELRTPIAVVQAHLERLQEDAHAADHALVVPAATLSALHGEMERLTLLVEDLFSLARVETGALQVRRAPTNLGLIVREVAAALRPLAQRERAITLTAHTPPGLPDALADGDRLRQILANLVRNAVRHTPEGGIIALSVAYEEPWLVVSVADTGEGIAPEHLERIFERFYRVDPARSRAGGGAGLGLAIVREFVEQMGGRVDARSVPGEGSVFRVFLAPVPRPTEDSAPSDRGAMVAGRASR